jgi:hypothetical protein
MICDDETRPVFFLLPKSQFRRENPALGTTGALGVWLIQSIILYGKPLERYLAQ